MGDKYSVPQYNALRLSGEKNDAAIPTIQYPKSSPSGVLKGDGNFDLENNIHMIQRYAARMGKRARAPCKKEKGFANHSAERRL